LPSLPEWLRAGAADSFAIETRGEYHRDEKLLSRGTSGLERMEDRRPH
jgi:hypothetical protein